MPLEEIPIHLEKPEDETPRNRRTERAVAEVGLPELIGDQNSVTQARAVRSEVLVEADDILSEWRTAAISIDGPKDPARYPAMSLADLKVREAQMALNRIRHQRDAAWWLSNSGRGARNLLEEAMEAVRKEGAEAT